jgi:hypothetical protein
MRRGGSASAYRPGAVSQSVAADTGQVTTIAVGPRLSSMHTSAGTAV